MNPETVVYKEKLYTIVPIYNNKTNKYHLLVLDNDNYLKIKDGKFSLSNKHNKNKAYPLVNKRLVHLFVIDISKKINDSYTCDHINRIKFDGRSENLRWANLSTQSLNRTFDSRTISDSKTNEIFTLNRGISHSIINKTDKISLRIYQSFGIPQYDNMNKYQIYSSTSNKLSLKFKIEQVKKYARILHNNYREIYLNCMKRTYSYKSQEELCNDYNNIISLCTYNSEIIDFNKVEILPENIDYLKEDLSELSMEEIDLLDNIVDIPDKNKPEYYFNREKKWGNKKNIDFHKEFKLEKNFNYSKETLERGSKITYENRKKNIMFSSTSSKEVSDEIKYKQIQILYRKYKGEAITDEDENILINPPKYREICNSHNYSFNSKYLKNEYIPKKMRYIKNKNTSYFTTFIDNKERILSSTSVKITELEKFIEALNNYSTIYSKNIEDIYIKYNIDIEYLVSKIPEQKTELDTILKNKKRKIRTELFNTSIDSHDINECIHNTLPEYVVYNIDNKSYQISRRHPTKKTRKYMSENPYKNMALLIEYLFSSDDITKKEHYDICIEKIHLHVKSQYINNVILELDKIIIIVDTEKVTDNVSILLLPEVPTDRVFPDGINDLDVPKFCFYVAPSGLNGCSFAIDRAHPYLKKLKELYPNHKYSKKTQIRTTSSSKLSTLDKLNQLKQIIAELYHDINN
jgi:hypothetical protein